MESEQTALRELERRQAEKAALLEAEQQLLKALERTKSEKQSLLDAEKMTQREIENSKIERRRLSAAMQAFMNLSRSQKNLLLSIAKQKAHSLLRVTQGASRLIHEAFIFSRYQRFLLGPPTKTNDANLSTCLDSSPPAEQQPLPSKGKRIVSKFLVYCNGLIGLNKPRMSVDEGSEENK